MKRMNDSAMWFGFVLAMALLGWAPTAQAKAGLIYDDDFSGASGTGINGLPPDVRPGSETWTASKWYANGTKYSTSCDKMYLPFTPESGKLYEVSGLVDATNTLIGVGFNLNFTTANEPGPWVYVDQDYTLANAIRGYLGAWTGGL